jgi:hypothetical protein
MWGFRKPGLLQSETASAAFNQLDPKLIFQLAEIR